MDGYAFKDFLRSGGLAPYEGWRLTNEERAKDLAEGLKIEDIAGLMLYSAHQFIPADNSSDPRHGAGPTAEYMGGTGEPISKWANGVSLILKYW